MKTEGRFSWRPLLQVPTEDYDEENTLVAEPKPRCWIHGMCRKMDVMDGPKDVVLKQEVFQGSRYIFCDACPFMGISYIYIYYILLYLTCASGA